MRMDNNRDKESEKTAHLVALLIRKAARRLQLHLLEAHHVLRERARLVGEQVRQAAELLGYRRVSYNSVRYLFILHHLHITARRS